jgi:hypothetical protein
MDGFLGMDGDLFNSGEISKFTLQDIALFDSATSLSSLHGVLSSTIRVRKELKAVGKRVAYRLFNLVLRASTFIIHRLPWLYGLF